MDLRENIKHTLSRMSAHKMRSFLTMLGMIIGISAVIIVMSVGAGAQSLILNQFETTGAAIVQILPGASDEEGPPASVMGITVTTLKYEDAKALEKKSNVPHLLAATAYVTGIATATWQNQKTDTNFIGTMANYLKVEDTEIEYGRFFNEAEEKSIARIAVLGSVVA